MIVLHKTKNIVYYQLLNFLKEGDGWELFCGSTLPPHAHPFQEVGVSKRNLGGESYCAISAAC